MTPISTERMIVSISVSLMLGFLTLTEAKSCDCGHWCKKFKGITVDETCYFQALQNPIYGKQFIVSDEKQELFLIKKILNGETSKPNLHISTNNSHKLTHFRQSCLPHSCNSTVYVNKCKCQLNVFETIIETIQYFYSNFSEMFWTVISVLLILLLSCLLKCVMCSCRQK